MSDERPTVACRLCGEATFMIGTKMCERCWQLERRITHDPDLAVKILKELRPTAFKRHE
jgi:hypothetical protein